MKRRDFLFGLSLGAVAAPAVAQKIGTKRRIGVLTPAASQWNQNAFVDELRKLGLIVGNDLVLELRSADGDLRQLPDLAEGLVAAGVEVIVAANTPAARAVIAVTQTHPVVIGAIADPVLLGFTSSLARPGGRVTGVANLAAEIAPKRLQVLKEAIPRVRRVVGFYHPDEPIVAPQIRDLREAATDLGIELKFSPVRTGADLEQAMQEASKWPADAAFRLAGQGITLAKNEAMLGLQHRLPTMALTAAGVRLGCLLSYFADHAALWRRVAHLVIRILNGEKPENLPFERATKFELALNLQTARVLGLSLPRSVLSRADEVIE